jgi:hypothetical protein
MTGLLSPVLFTAESARADDPPPSAERIRDAASEFDAGRRSFKDNDFEAAATHFENAFNDAANPLAIRSAILARKKAGQLARAATLASLASTRYPGDAKTAAVVREVLAEARPKLDRVVLHCNTACGVAADGRAISPADAVETVFFLEPGSHDLVVSWGDSRSKTATVVASAGGQEDLTYEAPPGAPTAKFTGVETAPPPPVVAPVPPPSGIHPAVFATGAALTAVSLGITIWSGIDTISDPGQTAVKTQCVGANDNTNCKAYVMGIDNQLRTNVLIGVTSGLGAVTAVIAIFTRWSSSPNEPTPPPRVEGVVTPLPGGGVLGLRGSF